MNVFLEGLTYSWGVTLDNSFYKLKKNPTTHFWRLNNKKVSQAQRKRNKNDSFWKVSVHSYCDDVRTPQCLIRSICLLCISRKRAKRYQGRDWQGKVSQWRSWEGVKAERKRDRAEAEVLGTLTAGIVMLPTSLYTCLCRAKENSLPARQIWSCCLSQCNTLPRFAEQYRRHVTTWQSTRVKGEHFLSYSFRHSSEGNPA